jgi:hypothetical protein
MGAFEDLVNRLQNPGDEGIPETIYDDLTKVYTDDVSIREAAANEKGAALQAANDEISRLKAINFDLMMKQPSEDSGNESGSDDSDSDDTESGIDDLFEKD